MIILLFLLKLTMVFICHVMKCLQLQSVQFVPFGHEKKEAANNVQHFYPTALKGCRGIVFTHGVRMGGRAGRQAAGKSLSGLYLRNHKV